MLPVVDDRLAVSQSEFDSFVRRHAHLAAVRRVVDNRDMTESCFMGDALGRFFSKFCRADCW